MVNVQIVINTATETLPNCGVAAAIGYMAARSFMSSLNPVYAAVVSAVSVVVSKVTSFIFDRIFSGPDASKSSRLLGNVLNITTSVALSAAISSSMGFPVTFPAFLYLNAITITAFSLVALGLVFVTGSGLYLEEIEIHN